MNKLKFLHVCNLDKYIDLVPRFNIKKILLNSAEHKIYSVNFGILAFISRLNDWL